MGLGRIKGGIGGKAARATLALALACGLAAPVAEAAGRARQRQGAAKAEVRRDVKRYDSRLFGPEVPLAEIVGRLGLPRDDDGKLLAARAVIIKSQRRLELYVGDLMVKAYRVQLGGRPTGDKEKAHDSRTPEGEYAVCRHVPGAYHRGLLINYPNLKDAQRGLAAGLIGADVVAAIEQATRDGGCPPQETPLGGWIMIHGQHPSVTAWLENEAQEGRVRLERGQVPGDGNPRSLHKVWDWTQGCVALLNPDVRELFDFLADGARLTIVADGVPAAPIAWPPPAEIDRGPEAAAPQTAPQAAPPARRSKKGQRLNAPQGPSPSGPTTTTK